MIVFSKQQLSRVVRGCKVIAPGLAHGALIGLLLVLVFPSIVSFGAIAFDKADCYYIKSVDSVWQKGLAAPQHVGTVLALIVFLLLILNSLALFHFLRRCFAWAIHDGDVALHRRNTLNCTRWSNVGKSMHFVCVRDPVSNNRMVQDFLN